MTKNTPYWLLPGRIKLEKYTTLWVKDQKHFYTKWKQFYSVESWSLSLMELHSRLFCILYCECEVVHLYCWIIYMICNVLEIILLFLWTWNCLFVFYCKFSMFVKFEILIFLKKGRHSFVKYENFIDVCMETGIVVPVFIQTSAKIPECTELHLRYLRDKISNWLDLIFITWSTSKCFNDCVRSLAMAWCCIICAWHFVSYIIEL